MRIGLIGNAGSGKDTVADYLVSQHGYKKVELKSALHETLMVASTLYANAVYVVGYEAAKRETSWVRPLLVKTGQRMKELFGEDIFTRYALEQSKGLDNVVVSDVRFEVEVRQLADAGFVFVEVARREADTHDAAEAMQAWRKLNNGIFTVHNDGTLDELYRAWDMILTP